MTYFANASFENEQDSVQPVDEMLEVVGEDRFALGSGRVKRSESAKFIKRGKEVVDLLGVFLEVVEFSLAGTPDRVRERMRFTVVLIMDTESSVCYMLLVLEFFLSKDNHVESSELLTVVHSNLPAIDALIHTQNPVLADSMSSNLLLKILLPMLMEVDLSSVVGVVWVGAGNIEDGTSKVHHAVR